MKKKIQKQMKEFDIEKAKAGAPLCTRSGLKARIVCFDVKSEKENHNIIALVETGRGYEKPVWYGDDGKFYVPNSPCPPTCYPECDLMMAPVKHEGWVVINPQEKHCFPCVFDTQEEAETKASSSKITDLDVVHIEWEE